MVVDVVETTVTTGASTVGAKTEYVFGSKVTTSLNTGKQDKYEVTWCKILLQG